MNIYSADITVPVQPPGPLNGVCGILVNQLLFSYSSNRLTTFVRR
jgi:hypothetical protein